MDAKSGRLARWVIQLGEFAPMRIEHRKGGSHSNVDAFTRVFSPADTAPENATLSALLFTAVPYPSDEDIREAQGKDAATHAAQAEQRDGIWGLREPQRWRPYLPRVLIPAAVKALHGHSIGAHFGPGRLLNMLRKSFVATIHLKEVRAMLNLCLLCKQRKSPMPQDGLLKSRVPDRPWGTVAMDFCGPYPQASDGSRYVLVFVDQFTKWVELIPTPDQTAITVLRAFYANIVCRHGCPQRLLSDNGPSFRAALIEAMCNQFGVKKVFTTTYYPQGDGYAERFMRTMNDSLASLTANSWSDWPDYLPGLAFGYNAAQHAATGVSPFELCRGSHARLPGGREQESQRDIAGAAYARRLQNIILQAVEKARRQLESYHGAMKVQFDKGRKDIRLTPGTQALIRLSDYKIAKYPSRKFAPRWSAPATIVQASPDGSTYIVQRGDSEERVNVTRLLPVHADAYGPAPEQETTFSTAKDASKAGCL